MGIMNRLLEYKLPIMGATSVAMALMSVVVMGPSLSTVINFFLPLLVSTALFLAAVAVLLKISPPPLPETVGDQTGEELMDYVVAGQAQQQGQGQGMVSLPNEEWGDKGEEQPESDSAKHRRSSG